MTATSSESTAITDKEVVIERIIDAPRGEMPGIAAEVWNQAFDKLAEILATQTGRSLSRASSMALPELV